jgi:branched-chain amino acid transport system ATP-binding protein
MEKIIEFDAVVAGYAPSLTILDGTTLDARKGEITLLIGPNGAGKSTVLRTLFGLLVPRSGEVRFEGRRINGTPPSALLAEGIAFVPQGRNLFGSLSVRHNLELGGITLPRGLLAARIEEVLERFPRIRERIDNQASTLSGGEQKQLEVGRALLLRPRVLLIDEPSIGLSPKLVQEVMTLLRKLADGGTTVLMVEQNVRTALKYANRALVLEMGRLALDRPAIELLGDPDLNRLFLGGAVRRVGAAAPAAAPAA